MGWTWNDRLTKPVVKQDGKCHKPSQHKFCPYWVAKHSNISGVVRGFKCLLFDKDKTGYDALDECNSKYGRTYEGAP